MKKRILLTVNDGLYSELEKIQAMKHADSLQDTIKIILLGYIENGYSVGKKPLGVYQAQTPEQRAEKKKQKEQEEMDKYPCIAPYCTNDFRTPEEYDNMLKQHLDSWEGPEKQGREPFWWEIPGNYLTYKNIFEKADEKTLKWVEETNTQNGGFEHRELGTFIKLTKGM